MAFQTIVMEIDGKFLFFLTFFASTKKSNKKSLAYSFFFTRYVAKIETKRTRVYLLDPQTAFCFIDFYNYGSRSQNLGRV